jgi:hypothetical protein
MKEIIVKQTVGRALKFKGEKVASAETSADRASGIYSGSTGRWTEYHLWKTSGGNYVGKQIHRTQWQGEDDAHEAKLLKSEKEVFDFFGDGGLAQELYEEAGLEFVEEVD